MKERITGPTMIKCFWCGNEKGIALPKRLPMKNGKVDADKWGAYHPPVVTDLEPCDKCYALWQQGVCFIEAGEENPLELPEGLAMVGRTEDGGKVNVYPTGRRIVIKPGVYGPYKQGDKVLMEPEAFEKVFGDVMS